MIYIEGTARKTKGALIQVSDHSVTDTCPLPLMISGQPVKAMSVP